MTQMSTTVTSCRRDADEYLTQMTQMTQMSTTVTSCRRATDVPMALELGYSESLADMFVQEGTIYLADCKCVIPCSSKL